MGNGSSIPHLQSESTGSIEDQEAARVNNHIRTMLWDWWVAAENGVYVEYKTGLRRLLKNCDYKNASDRDNVKKVLLLSNNGEDVSLFIEWVTDEAPKKTVETILSFTTPREMIDFVWSRGLQKVNKNNKKVWALRSKR